MIGGLFTLLDDAPRSFLARGIACAWAACPPSPAVTAVTRPAGDPAHDGFVTASRPFHFTARVPTEGNYRVTVVLGDPAEPSGCVRAAAER